MAFKVSLLLLSGLFSVVYGGTLITTDGEEQVVIRGGQVKCGKLSCPPGSTQCTIRKINNNQNNRLVDVTRQCLDSNQNIAAELNEQFEAKNGERYNIYLNSGSEKFHNLEINSNLDQQKQHELEVEANTLLKQIQKEIQTNVSAVMQRFQKQLKDLGFAFKNL